MAFSHTLAANTKDETVEHTSELYAKPHRPLLVQIKYYNMSSSMSDSVKDLITEQQPHENDTIMKNDLIPVSVCVCVCISRSMSTHSGKYGNNSENPEAAGKDFHMNQKNKKIRFLSCC